LPPGGGSTVHIYTHTHSTQYDTINLGRVLAVPCFCDLYPGICLTTEEKAWKNLSQGSRRVPVGTMKTEYTEQYTTIRIYKYNKSTQFTKLNKNIEINI